MLLIRGRETLAGFREIAKVLDLSFLTVPRKQLLNMDLHVENLLLHGGVPVVFDRVVRSPFQVLRDNSPLILLQSVLDVQNELLFHRPFVLFYPWIQMVVPSFTALLADATWEPRGDICPFHSTGCLDE